MSKCQLVATGFLVFALAAFLVLSRTLDKPTVLNPPKQGTARVHFSDGRVILYSASKLDRFKWIALKANAYNPPFVKQLTLFAARLVGLRKFWISDPATLVGLESHLSACGQYTRQSFFLHEHFAEYLGQLNFFFGATKSARTSIEWVEANLNSIRINRIAVGPKGARDFVSCAVIVDRDSIRIIPESILLDENAQPLFAP